MTDSTGGDSNFVADDEDLSDVVDDKFIDSLMRAIPIPVTSPSGSSAVASSQGMSCHGHGTTLTSLSLKQPAVVASVSTTASSVTKNVVQLQTLVRHLCLNMQD